jgi:acetyl esterase
VSSTLGARNARGLPAEFERQIRARGAVLDMPLTQSLYAPLLEAQRRDGVGCERDLAYGPDAWHRLDVYRPLQARAPLPVLVFLHGGGFIRGDKSARENVGQYFARQGFVVVVPNYRLAPAHCWPAGAEDVAAAWQWVQESVAAYGGDPARSFLGGESAGAAHVAAAALVRRFHPRAGLRPAGVMLVSGVYNARLEFMARRQFGIETPDLRNDAYFGADPDRLAAKSTVELIDAPAVPMLITFAELDLLQMQVQAGELFARLLTRHGFDPSLRVIAAHNHLTQVYAVNTGDETLSSALLEFMHGH